MKKSLAVLALGLMAAFSMFASSTTCPNGPLAQYLVGGFSCTSGALTFSNWAFSNPAVPSLIAIPAASVDVQVITTTGNEGFNFNPLMSVTGPGFATQDVRIQFTVTGPVTDLHLDFNGSYSGTGIATVSENYCLNSTSPTCNPPQGGQLTVVNPGGIFSANVPNFDTYGSPVTSLTVVKDMNVSTGVGNTSNDNAHISQVTNTFSNSAVPEPATLALIGGGLTLMALVRRRRARR